MIYSQTRRSSEQLLSRIGGLQSHKTHPLYWRLWWSLAGLSKTCFLNSFSFFCKTIFVLQTSYHLSVKTCLQWSGTTAVVRPYSWHFEEIAEISNTDDTNGRHMRMPYNTYLRLFCFLRGKRMMVGAWGSLVMNEQASSLSMVAWEWDGAVDANNFCRQNYYCLNMIKQLTALWCGANKSNLFVRISILSNWTLNLGWE